MATTTPDESVIITESEDGKSFTVSENPDYVPAPAYVYDSTPMSNGEKIGLSLFGLAFAGFVGAVGYFAHKENKKIEAEAAERQAEMKRKREERAAWFDTQRKEGRTVVETVDGKFLAIPNEAYASAEVRVKGV